MANTGSHEHGYIRCCCFG